MSITRLLTRPVAVVTRAAGVLDDYGNPTTGAATTVTTTAYLRQTSAIEITVGQDTTSSTWLIDLPPGTPLTARDRITVPDMPATFEVIGVPYRPRVPGRGESHVQARLAEVSP